MNTVLHDSDSYVEIAEGIFWVGSADHIENLHCNVYLIVDGNEAVLIDSGSRGDFSAVMTKIMRTGTDPKRIIRLIYQHYDPDLCGNMPHMEALIHNDNLRILSHKENNLYINYYSVHSRKDCIEEQGFFFDFSSGRRLVFIRTPYAHAPGSFMTYDTKTKVLFSSDLFSGYDVDWHLFVQFGDACQYCDTEEVCPATDRRCLIHEILRFHKRTMTSEKALRFALEQIAELDISLIAPQHGSIIQAKPSQRIIINKLKKLRGIGIEHYLEEYAYEWIP